MSYFDRFRNPVVLGWGALALSAIGMIAFVLWAVSTSENPGRTLVLILGTVAALIAIAARSHGPAPEDEPSQVEIARRVARLRQ